MKDEMRKSTYRVKVKKCSSKKEMQPQKVHSKAKERQREIVIKLPLLSKLESKVNETVIGQEDVVRAVCTKVYEGIIFPVIKGNILIVGKSGTGKTEIVKQIANNLKFPLTIEDATSYTQEGYIGASVIDMIYNIISAANGNIELAKRGIIFIDEIDKKVNSEGMISDISKGDVLKSLLKIMEGTIIRLENPLYYLNPEVE